MKHKTQDIVQRLAKLDRVLDGMSMRDAVLFLLLAIDDALLEAKEQQDPRTKPEAIWAWIAALTAARAQLGHFDIADSEESNPLQ